MHILTKKNIFARVACALGLAVAIFGTTATGHAQSSSSSSQTTDPQATAAPGTIAAKAGTVIAPSEYMGPKYNNRWEIYGGLLLMNGQAGQNLSHRYNMGGGEIMGTYWLGTAQSQSFFKRHFGLDADYRFGAGTTPVISADNINRVLVQQSIASGGLQYRWLKNRYVALDLHALAGATTGIFNHATNEYTPGTVAYCPAVVQSNSQVDLQLYCNHTAPWGAAGGSIDFNESAKWTVRLSPDMTFEHFGTETREFFSISAGVMYRFGKKADLSTMK